MMKTWTVASRSIRRNNPTNHFDQNKAVASRAMASVLAHYVLMANIQVEEECIHTWVNDERRVMVTQANKRTHKSETVVPLKVIGHVLGKEH